MAVAGASLQARCSFLLYWPQRNIQWRK